MTKHNTAGGYLVDLLALSVSGKDTGELKLPNGVELAEIFKLAKRHGLTAMVYEALPEKLLAGCDANEYAGFTELYYKSIVKETEQDIALDEVCEALTEGGASVMPIKGIVCKHYYPKTYYRSMTDVDLLYRGISRDYAHDIMESLGYAVSGSTASYHDTFVKPPHVSVELHVSPVSQKDLSAPYFDTVFSRAVEGENGRLSMTSEDEYIYMIAHAARHFFDGGLGIRPLLDIYLFRRAHGEAIDKKYIKKILKSVRLESFEHGMLELVKYWFEGNPSEFVNDSLEEFFLSCEPHGTAVNSRLARAARRRGFLARISERFGIGGRREDEYRKLELIFAKFR